MSSPMSTPSPRTLLFFLTLTTLFTLLQHLDLSHPQNDTITQQLSTQTHRLTLTTQRNRHANRCVIIRDGTPSTPRTPIKTPCDVLYLTASPLPNATDAKPLTRGLPAVLYVAEFWEGVSRTYNDGITYISNDQYLPHPPITSHSVHTASYNRSATAEWFSLSPHPGARPTLRRWLRRRSPDCQAGVTCHATMEGYSCTAAVDVHACRRRDWGACILRALVLAAGLCLAAWRVYALARVMLGRPTARAHVAVTWAGLCVVGVAMAGMDHSDVAWLLSRLVGVRHGVVYDGRVPREGDVYRAVAGLVGRYDGYAYEFCDGVRVVRVAGPGVGLVVGGVAMALFVKRALLRGLLVRVLIGVVGVGVACGAMERVVRKRAKVVVEEGDEYLSGDVAKKFVKQGRSRLFVRERR